MRWGSAAALTLFVVRNTHVLSARIHADGDFAANGLLIDRALEWRLLHGHYSRVGFFHPGPAFLYVQGWSQWLFHDVLGVLPEPFNAHLFGTMLLNAVLLGVVAHLVFAHTRSAVVTAAGMAAVLWFATRERHLVTSTWAPEAFFVPFLLFTVAAASVYSGRSKSVPWLVLSGGLLVHGHVSFFGFVGPIALVLAAAFVVRHRGRLRAAVRERRRPLLIGVGVGAVLALPIALHTALHWPGEFDEYIEYATSERVGSNSLGDVLSYALDFWATGPSRALLVLGVVLLAGAAVWQERDAETRRFLAAVLVVAAAASVLFVNYGLRGIDDLTKRYIGLFYLAVPALVLAVVAVAAARRVGTLPALAATLAVLVAASTAPEMRNSYRGERRLPGMHDALRRSRTTLVAEFPHNDWPVAAGLMHYSGRLGLRVCAADRTWEHVVTKELVCTERDREAGRVVRIHDQPAVPDGPVVYSDDRFVITAPPP